MRYFSHLTLEECEVVAIQKQLSVKDSNRDESNWDNPTEFNIINVGRLTMYAGLYTALPFDLNATNSYLLIGGKEWTYLPSSYNNYHISLSGATLLTFGKPIFCREDASLEHFIGMSISMYDSSTIVINGSSVFSSDYSDIYIGNGNGTNDKCIIDTASDFCRKGTCN